MSASDRLATLIEGQYRATPGLRLTLTQACRLWHLDQRTCEDTLTTLVREGVLHRTPHGRYVALPTPRSQVKAVHNSTPDPRVVRTDAGESAWLFTRGRQSVRIARRADRSGRCELLVQGPGSDGGVYQFGNVIDCMKRQAEIEREVVGQGYHLERHISERRTVRDSRSDTRSDRRR